jgi:hypothetical protein
MSLRIPLMVLSLLAASICYAEDAAAEAKPAFDETKEVPAGAEWNRDINIKNACKIDVVLISENKKNMMIITDKAYQALKSGDAKGMTKEDLIADVAHEAGETKSSIELKPGHYWFFIKNEGTEKASIQMQWFEAK